MIAIRHVSKRAPVSVGTVSDVFSESDKVRPELRKRVEEAIRELDYSPNQIAQPENEHDEGEATHIATAQTGGTAMVCLNRMPRGVDVESVSVDNRKGARMRMHHLVSRGHRRIGMLFSLAHHALP